MLWNVIYYVDMIMEIFVYMIIIVIFFSSIHKGPISGLFKWNKERTVSYSSDKTIKLSLVLYSINITIINLLKLICFLLFYIAISLEFKRILSQNIN